MMKLDFDRADSTQLNILCLGAHSDDIEIGCGGTLLKLMARYPNAQIRWVVFGASGERISEASNSAENFLRDISDKKVIVGGFRDGFFPYLATEIKEYFEEIKFGFDPDLILTHYRDDRHQDHRLISDLTWNTFRNHTIWEYEIPKYDGDLGIPNLFVHLSEEVCQQKISHLFEHFATQSHKSWFTEDTFLALLRIRGMESNSPSKYAEAFYCRKAIF
jgi:LmbE family N-acetylglucosaminyl deacetylase